MSLLTLVYLAAQLPPHQLSVLEIPSFPHLCTCCPPGSPPQPRPPGDPSIPGAWQRHQVLILGKHSPLCVWVGLSQNRAPSSTQSPPPPGSHTPGDDPPPPWAPSGRDVLLADCGICKSAQTDGWMALPMGALCVQLPSPRARALPGVGRMQAALGRGRPQRFQQ